MIQQKINYPSSDFIHLIYCQHFCYNILENEIKTYSVIEKHIHRCPSYLFIMWPRKLLLTIVFSRILNVSPHQHHYIKNDKNYHFRPKNIETTTAHRAPASQKPAKDRSTSHTAAILKHRTRTRRPDGVFMCMCSRLGRGIAWLRVAATAARAKGVGGILAWRTALWPRLRHSRRYYFWYATPARVQL